MKGTGASTKIHARRRAHERHLRAEVRQLSACLGSLNDLDRRFLSLRAGLHGPPLSRAQAARELGISNADARVVERHGLRVLRQACGASPAPESVRTIATSAPRMPQLQPATLLVATGGAAPRPLVDQQELSGRHGVKGVHATSPEADGPAVASTAVSRPLATASSERVDGAWLAVVAVLALMGAVALLVMRSRPRTSAAAGPAAPAENLAPVTAVAAAPVAPSAEPEPEPEEAAAEEPVAAPRAPVAPPSPAARGRDYRRAAMIASGLASVVARELMRRRRGRR